MVLRDQFLGDLLVLDALANLAGDEVAQQGVGLLVDQHVAEIALPDAEPLLAIKLLEERLALLGRHLMRGARVWRMQEAGEGFLATLEHLRIAGPDFAHLLGADLAVVQRRAPVGSALEHGEAARGLGNLLDGLHAGGAGADHRHALPFEADRLVRPARSVAGLALEALYARDAGHGRRGKGADGGDQETCGEVAAVFQHDIPAPRRVAVVGGAHPGLELDVAAQVELVGDEVEITQSFRLG